MAFTPKDWQNKPNQSTPISAEALEDMEMRLSAYSDSLIAALSPIVNMTTLVAFNAETTP